MKTWLYRIALFMLLFGTSASTFGNNYSSSLLNAMINLAPLVSLAVIVICYFSFPGFYKAIAWVLVLSVILLVLESKYEYNQFMYSYFVIKRFAYCGVALSTYYVVSKAGPLKIEYAINIIFGILFLDQILLGQIFSYNLTSETRTTLSPDALYLVIPFVYYLVRYIREYQLKYLVGSLFTFIIIAFLLHRTVISAAAVAAGIVFILAVLGKVSTTRLPIGRTLVTFAIMLVVVTPFTDLLPESKVTSFMTSISGIFSPKEDNTGSWRVEQAEYYLSQVPERPWFGWRYTGYDRGEIMENEDFPEKGTIIHSQYIDMLYNYGAFGVFINVLLMVSALFVLYRSKRTLSVDQLVLFSFIVSGMVYAISYQLPVYYWGIIGVGMYYGLYPPIDHIDAAEYVDYEEFDKQHSSSTIAL